MEQDTSDWNLVMNWTLMEKICLGLKEGSTRQISVFGRNYNVPKRTNGCEAIGEGRRGRQGKRVTA